MDRKGSISVPTLLSMRNVPVTAINSLTIPNITVPPNLTARRKTQAPDSISILIRPLFNGVTRENVQQLCAALRQIVIEKAHSVELLDEVAEEILQNFIIDDKKIDLCLLLLNSVFNATVLLQTDKSDRMEGTTRTSRPDKSNNHDENSDVRQMSDPIGRRFIYKCKVMVFDCINKNNIAKLAKCDLDNMIEKDLYNRERDKIFNLILILCTLYDQKDKPATIRLTGIPLYTVIRYILDNHADIQNQMNELGDPYKGECSNEEEYEYLRRMSNLYAEQLCIFFDREGKNFRLDKTAIPCKSGKSTLLAELIERFQITVFPFITEAYISSKYDHLMKL